MVKQLIDLHLFKTKFEASSMKRLNSLPWHSYPKLAVG